MFIEEIGTLNEANPSDTLVPSSTPLTFRVAFDLTNLLNAGDDFVLSILTGPAAAEILVAWFEITSNGVDLSIDYGDELPVLVKFRKLDVGPFILSSGNVIKLNHARTSLTDRNINYEVVG